MENGVRGMGATVAQSISSEVRKTETDIKRQVSLNNYEIWF
jgi:hypothetical protein